MRDWASLERGLLRDIFTRLPTDTDVVSFRHVCHHWRVAAGPGAPIPRPWFVLSRPNSAPSVDGTLAYVRPMQRHGRSHIRVVPMEVSSGKEEWVPTRVSSRGWIAMSRGHRLLLRDPISGIEVPLPSIDPVYQLISIFLSDDPIAARGGFTVFAFFSRTSCPFWGHLLAFCRPGDVEWTRIDADDGQSGQIRFFQGLEFFGGRVYVVLFDYRVAVCDVDTRRLVVSSVKINFTCYDELYSQDCLVECGGDLLFAQVSHRLVARRRSLCCFGGRPYDLKFWVRVIKIELDPNGMPMQCSDVEEIGDYALFMVSQGHAFALPASGFPNVKAGCVYHLSVHLTMDVAGMVVTDLRQRPHRHENVKKLPLVGPCRPLSWFCPRRPILDDTATKRRS